MTAERIWRDGALPTNTNGGRPWPRTSAGPSSSRWSTSCGEAGPCQIEGAELLHWGTVFGDSVILTNNPDACVR